MNITRQRLKQIIKEEIAALDEGPFDGVRRMINPSRELVPEWVDRAHEIWINNGGGTDDWRRKDSEEEASRLGWDTIKKTEAGDLFQGDVTRLASESNMITRWIAKQLCMKFGPGGEGRCHTIAKGA